MINSNYFPDPDDEGYVYADTINDDIEVFGDILVNFQQVDFKLSDKSLLEERSKLPLKLWLSRFKLKPLKILDYQHDEDDKLDQENIDLIVDNATVAPIQYTFVNQVLPVEFPLGVPFSSLGNPQELQSRFKQVGYICDPQIAINVSLLLSSKPIMVRSLLLEGQPGTGKTFTAECLAKITTAEMYYVSCYAGMNFQNLVEYNSIGEKEAKLGILPRAFKASQTRSVVLLIDEVDKAHESIDTLFLGPLQTGSIVLESQETILANLENIVVLFTKNFNRRLDEALLRRLNPIEVKYLDPELEIEILTPHLPPQIANNLVKLANIFRSCDGFYKLERPPAPDELILAGRYLLKMLEWQIERPELVGKSLFPLFAKSERDRIVCEQILRFHPLFADPEISDPRLASNIQIMSKLGNRLLEGFNSNLKNSPQSNNLFKVHKIGWQYVGPPKVIIDKLTQVGFECPEYLAKQIGLLLNVKRDMVKTFLLEGPPGCGKSFLAKCLARISGADFMELQCYKGMETRYLLEHRNEVAIAKASAGIKIRDEDLIEYGILSRAFLKSQSQPVVLLVDEIDKVEGHIDTFFLGPIQEGRIWLQSSPVINANLDNLLLIFTKNYERTLNDALMRRVHPLTMTYLDSDLEIRILSAHCIPRLIENLVSLTDIMRHNQGSYEFDRPPAPEELLTTGRYIMKLIEWGYDQPADVGFQVWRMIAKSERDRAVLEHLLRYNANFHDHEDGEPSGLNIEIIYARLGKLLLKGIIRDNLNSV
jgi:MoxR-like ATPase